MAFVACGGDQALRLSFIGTSYQMAFTMTVRPVLSLPLLRLVSSGLTCLSFPRLYPCHFSIPFFVLLSLWALCITTCPKNEIMSLLSYHLILQVFFFFLNTYLYIQAHLYPFQKHFLKIASPCSYFLLLFPISQTRFQKKFKGEHLLNTEYK